MMTRAVDPGRDGFPRSAGPAASPLKLLARTELARRAEAWLELHATEETVPACCRRAGHRAALLERVATWAPAEATDSLTAAAIMLLCITSVRLLAHTPCSFDCPATLWLVDDVLTDAAHHDRRNAYWVRALAQSTISVRHGDVALEFMASMGTAPLPPGSSKT